jgi:aminoglycoside phosphotransferase (APT) family kinase protein
MGIDLHSRDLEATRATLERWLTTVLPTGTRASVNDLQLPAAGASNETILFHAAWDEAGGPREERLVLRVQPSNYQLFPDGDVFLQWRVMKALAQHHPQVPTPQVRWREHDATVLGAPFYVMTHVDGEVPNGYHSALMQALEADQRANLFRNGLRMLATFHRLDWTRGFDFLLPQHGPPGLESYLGWVQRWYEWARDGRHFDAVERAITRLRDDMPPDTEISLLWGDSRPGNIMFSPDDQRVAAVLDWEIANVATPEADVGWWLMFEHLFARQHAAPEGVPSRDETLSFYESCLGRPLRDMAYFDLLAWTRLSVTFIRHVDLERGGPREPAFSDLAVWVEEQVDRCERALARGIARAVARSGRSSATEQASPRA